MKRLLMLLFPLLFAWTLSAQDVADAILGNYKSTQDGYEFKARISKKTDGTYIAKVYWIKDAIDPATGEKRKDVKNPNKALRDTPCDRIVLMDGLRYNAEKNQWGETKVYDPLRGIRANVVVRFLPDGRLAVKGSLLGISETVYWTRV
jgi:uncharacterized protein (DUF2147 family)